MSRVRAISKSDVHRICSGQVVLDLAGAVKELVENSIDAGATRVDVKLRDHGGALVEVSDNGSGVPEEDYQNITLKYHTSKIAEFSDLASVASFGFRGEALSSLCALSTLTITTRTAAQPMAVKLTYDHNGKLVGQTPVARGVGTTVTLESLFHALPVRLREFTRNKKREYVKMLGLLQAYGLVSTGVRISCTHHTAKGKRSVVLQTRGNTKVLDNITNIFGPRQSKTMIRVDTAMDNGAITITGHVSSAVQGSGRASADRQFYFLNKRPVDLARIAKAVNDTYRMFNAQQKPVVVLNVSLPAHTFDVNVTPDKRKVMLHREDAIIEHLREALSTLFEPAKYTYSARTLSECSTFAQSKPPVQRAQSTPAPAPAPVPSPPAGAPAEAPSRVMPPAMHTAASVPAALPSHSGSKRKSSPPPPPPQRDGEGEGEGGVVEIISPAAVSPASPPAPKRARIEPPAHSHNDHSHHDHSYNDHSQHDPCHGDHSHHDHSHDDHSHRSHSDHDHSCDHSHDQTPHHGDVLVSAQQDDAGGDGDDDVRVVEEAGDVRNTRVLRTLDLNRDVVVEWDINRVRAATAPTPPSAPAATPPPSTAPTAPEVDANAVHDCSFQRVFKKEDFLRLRVIGQFNLGFIMCCLGPDLYIVDQHASDEIYNFERLTATTTLHNQKLIQPLPLQLTAVQEEVILDERETFERNGFAFAVDMKRAPGDRVRLAAVPFSKGTTFGLADVHEMVGRLMDHPGEFIRPTKVRAMLAMRACRSSIMVGTALNKEQMRRVLDHMGTMERPWACPHGRPTMRHVCDMSKKKE